MNNKTTAIILTVFLAFSLLTFNSTTYAEGSLSSVAEWGQYHLKYTVTGATLVTPPVYTDPFGYDIYTYSGKMDGATLTISGTGWVEQPSKADNDFKYVLYATVSVGADSKTYKYSAPKGEILNKSFSLSVPIPAGATSGSFTMRVDYYNSYYGPRGVVVGGTLTQTVTPTPKPSPKPNLSVTPDNRDVPAAAGTTTFSVSNTGGGTMPWTAYVKTDNTHFKITSGSSGTNSGIITVAYDANPTTSPRFGMIRVTATDADGNTYNVTGSPKEVTINQAASTPQPTPTHTPPTPAPTACKYFKEDFSGVSSNTWTSGNGRWYEDNNDKLNVDQIASGKMAYYQTSFNPDGFFVIDTDVDVVSIAAGGAYAIYPFTNGSELIGVDDKKLEGVGVILYSSGNARLFGFDIVGKTWYTFAKFVTTPPVTSIGVAYSSDKITLRINKLNMLSFSGSFGNAQSVIDSLWLIAQGDSTHVRFDNVCADPIATPTSTGKLPVYRFFNTIAGGHFFTMDEAEKNTVIQNYSHFRPEGIGFYAFPTEQIWSLPVYRFFNTIAGGHFFTMDEAEKNIVIQNYPHFRPEGIGFYAFPKQEPGTLPVYRFFNTNAGGHFFTMDEAEKNTVIQNYKQFRAEGVGFYAYPSQ